MGFTDWNYTNTPSIQTQRQNSGGFADWGNATDAPAETSYDSSWNNDTITDNFANEDWSADSWRHDLPDHSGTKNPQNDPERVRRIEYLENQLYYLRDDVKMVITRLTKPRSDFRICGTSYVKQQVRHLRHERTT